MESVWYYARGGAQTGPVSFDDLKAAIAAGHLGRDDLVWKEGTADWVPAQHVSGLFPAAAAAAAASAPAPAPALSAVPPVPAPRAAATAPTSAAPAPMSIYDEAREWPTGEKPGAAEILALAKEFLRRTATTNPSAVAPNPDEEKRLTRVGYDATTKKIAVWRRAVLWVSVVPTAFAAFFGLLTLIDMEPKEKEVISTFGMLLLYVQAFSLFALPATAVLAALAFDRLTKSAKLVLLGGAISIGVPLLVAFVPADVLLDIKGDGKQTVEQLEAMRTSVGLVIGIGLYLALTPLILSLLPAVARACFRIKTFLPESLVPGWGLVASVPLFVLLTLTTMVIVYHWVGNALLMLALVLWIGAPLLYLLRFRILTRPITESQDLVAMNKIQRSVLGCFVGGIVLLVIYLITAKVGGQVILGTDSDKSHVQLWSLGLHVKWIEYLGRSLFLTVLFADLLVRMAVMVWPRIAHSPGPVRPRTSTARCPVWAMRSNAKAAPPVK